MCALGEEGEEKGRGLVEKKEQTGGLRVSEAALCANWMWIKSIFAESWKVP